MNTLVDDPSALYFGNELKYLFGDEMIVVSFTY
jgi:hypothetical protein